MDYKKKYLKYKRKYLKLKKQIGGEYLVNKNGEFIQLGVCNEKTGFLRISSNKNFYLGIKKYFMEKDKCEDINFDSKEFINYVQTLTLNNPKLILNDIKNLMDKNHDKPEYLLEFLHNLVNFINKYIEIRPEYKDNREIFGLLTEIDTIIHVLTPSTDSDEIAFDITEGARLKRYA